MTDRADWQGRQNLRTYDPFRGELKGLVTPLPYLAWTRVFTVPAHRAYEAFTIEVGNAHLGTGTFFMRTWCEATAHLFEFEPRVIAVAKGMRLPLTSGWVFQDAQQTDALYFAEGDYLEIKNSAGGAFTTSIVSYREYTQ